MKLTRTERLYWRSSGSLRIPPAFRRMFDVTRETLPEPVDAEVHEVNGQVRLTYVFDRTSFPHNTE